LALRTNLRGLACQKGQTKYPNFLVVPLMERVWKKEWLLLALPALIQNNWLILLAAYVIFPYMIISTMKVINQIKYVQY